MIAERIRNYVRTSIRLQADTNRLTRRSKDQNRDLSDTCRQAKVSHVAVNGRLHTNRSNDLAIEEQLVSRKIHCPLNAKRPKTAIPMPDIKRIITHDDGVTRQRRGLSREIHAEQLRPGGRELQGRPVINGDHS